MIAKKTLSIFDVVPFFGVGYFTIPTMIIKPITIE
jgi:hypothetical protein